MLVQRLRRWPNIEPALCQSLVFAAWLPQVLWREFSKAFDKLSWTSRLSVSMMSVGMRTHILHYTVVYGFMVSLPQYIPGRDGMSRSNLARNTFLANSTDLCSRKRIRREDLE